MEEGIKTNRKKGRLPLTIALSVALFLIAISIEYKLNGIKSPEFYSLLDYMESEIYNQNGDVKTYDNGDFGILKKNEKAIITVKLPDDISIAQAEFYLSIYNGIVSVSIDGKLIYEDAYFNGNISDHYGGYVYEVPLPDDYAGRTLTIEITSVENIPYSDFKNIGIISSKDAWKKLLNSNDLIFSLSITLMVLAAICVFYFFIRSFQEKKVQLGLPIAFFEILINAWFFGSMQMFYLIIDNVEFCAKIEYYALFLAPLPLAIIIYYVVDVPFVKKMVTAVSFIYLLYYIIATAIELSPMERNYSDMLKSLHLLAGILLVTLIFAIFLGTKDKSNNYIYILRYGILISMLCGIFELVRFNVTKFLMNKSWFTTHGLSSLAILVIALSLVIYLISFSTEEYTSKIEKEQLLLLAYKDALTGMPNRASCYKQIEEMEEKGIKEYTMVFIDVNNLKLANDKFGHETGDKLLKMTAEKIMNTFAEKGFASRWGGDEFVACVLDNEAKAKKLVKEFKEKLEAVDASGSFPFKVSAACGYIYVNKENYIDPVEAIRQADSIMYENKKLMKASM
ncbi:MAG: GGDEF domain-containing protein [Lachnospiraceae bacterium]|nr:GGDEF domain-containing protein [Lachnospiraceae bacterium]